MTASLSSRIQLLSLIAGLGLVSYFIIQKLNKSKNQPLPNPAIAGQPLTPPALNVAQKIEVGYNKDLVTFDQAAIKKFAGWIDAIIAEVAALKKSGKKEATAKMVYNAATLKSMSDANLKAVVNYWEKVRVSKILKSPIFGPGYIDNSETIPSLLARLMDLGYS